MTKNAAPFVYGPVRRVLLTLVWGALHVAACCLAGLVYRKLAIHFGMDASPYITIAMNPLAGILTLILLQTGYLYAMGRALGMNRSSIFPTYYNAPGWSILIAGTLGFCAMAVYTALPSVNLFEDRLGDDFIVIASVLFFTTRGWPVLTAIWVRANRTPQVS